MFRLCLCGYTTKLNLVVTHRYLLEMVSLAAPVRSGSARYRSQEMIKWFSQLGIPYPFFEQFLQKQQIWPLNEPIGTKKLDFSKLKSHRVASCLCFFESNIFYTLISDALHQLVRFQSKKKASNQIRTN